MAVLFFVTVFTGCDNKIDMSKSSGLVEVSIEDVSAGTAAETGFVKVDTEKTEAKIPDAENDRMTVELDSVYYFSEDGSAVYRG